MICKCCGIEFDTSGLTGTTVRCPQCGSLYRRKAPQDPRAGLTVPVFIPKGQAAPESTGQTVPDMTGQMTPGSAERTAPGSAGPAVPGMTGQTPPGVSARMVSGPAGRMAPVQPANSGREAAAWGNGNRNGYPGNPGSRPGLGNPAAGTVKRKKTHHVRTTFLLLILLVIALTALTLTGLWDIFPRPVNEDFGTETQQTEEQPAEAPAGKEPGADIRGLPGPDYWMTPFGRPPLRMIRLVRSAISSGDSEQFRMTQARMIPAQPKTTKL